MDNENNLKNINRNLSKSERSKRRKAAKDRIANAYSENSNVEVIPAKRDIVPDVPEKLRVAAYCRVSTDNEAQAGSYQLQIQYYTEYIQNNPNWIFVGVYADEGLSGTSTKKRVQFRQMIEDCRNGKIDLIITKSISRFARNTLDTLRYMRELKNFSSPIGIQFETECLNTLDKGAEMIITVLSCVAQGESEAKSESIKWSVHQRFANGLPLCPTYFLLGYDTDEDKNMVIVEEEAVIIRFIYEKFLDGYSVKQIAEMLTANQVLTVKGKEIWSSSVVRNILHNERYCGDVLMQKTVTTDCLSHKCVKNTGQEKQYRMINHHPAIIPREDWLTVQEMLKFRRFAKNRDGPPKRKIRPKYVHGGILDGFLILNPKWDAYDIHTVLKKYQDTNFESEEL